jgi:hypothetical protein
MESLTMRALVALVVIMGVAILVALALVAYGLVGRMQEGAVSMNDVSLPLPAGCRLADSFIDDGRLFVRVDGLPEQDCQRIVILDLESGAIVGRVVAVPEAN